MALHLEIVTPEKKTFSDTVDNVYLPGADGELGILASHAGLVTALQPGELRYLRDGQINTLAVGSGFAEIGKDKVIVLTDMALGEAEIDEQATEDAIAKAEDKLKGIDHSLASEEAAHLQELISRQTAALHFKRKNMH